MVRVVRPGCATNETGIRVRQSSKVVGRVCRDGHPVNIQAIAVVDVLKMPPQSVPVSPLLASAADPEVLSRLRFDCRAGKVSGESFCRYHTGLRSHPAWLPGRAT